MPADDNPIPRVKANPILYVLDIRQHIGNTVIENSTHVDKAEHRGMICELSSPDGIYLRYYNLTSAIKGKATIKCHQPFVQLSYNLNGNKKYDIKNGTEQLVSFKKRESNYLFLPEGDFNLSWEAGEQLEAFELSICPQLMMMHLSKVHPFFAVLQQSISKNEPAVISESNFLLQQKSNDILCDMLNCPLEDYYKRLYLKSKLGELLALELEACGQLRNKLHMKYPGLKPDEVERMFQAKEIILSNLHQPCSLIDLARKIGTNDAYLKKQFKEVFGHTVYGYLQLYRMKEAKTMLLNGKSVSTVAFYVGYKHVGHFTRAFKKYFGINPNQVKP